MHRMLGQQRILRSRTSKPHGLDLKKSLSVELTSDQTRKIVLFAQSLKGLCECLGNLLLLTLRACDLHLKKRKKYPKPWTENVHPATFLRPKPNRQNARALFLVQRMSTNNG
jgi:hypothetical protein